MNEDRAVSPTPDNFTAASIAYLTAFAFSRGLSPEQVAQQLRSVYGDRVPGSNSRAQSQTGRFCTIEGCTKPVKARGWCGAHYERNRLYGDPTFYPARQQKEKPDSPTDDEIRAEMREALDRGRGAIE